jgi:hypothetical protein
MAFQQKGVFFRYQLGESFSMGCYMYYISRRVMNAAKHDLS